MVISSAQDTTLIDTSKNDTDVVIKQTEEIMIEQKIMNTEMRNQLEFLRDRINKQDTVNNPNKE